MKPKIDLVALAFSPGKNTLKALQLLKTLAASHQLEMELHNFTANPGFWSQKNYTSYFEQMLPPHRLLIVASPVYARGIPRPWLDVLSFLPEPDHNYASQSIPLITYGGVTSGNALHQLGLQLSSTGRTNILGTKLLASHTLTQNTPYPIYPDLPGKNSLATLEELLARIKFLIQKPEFQKEALMSFDYQHKKEEKLARPGLKPREIIIQEHSCQNCASCQNVCPIQRLILKENTLVIRKNAPICIQCQQCVKNCPSQAISLDFPDLSEFLAHIAISGKPISEEIPLQAVYPLAPI